MGACQPSMENFPGGMMCALSVSFADSGIKVCLPPASMKSEDSLRSATLPEGEHGGTPGTAFPTGAEEVRPLSQLR